MDYTSPKLRTGFTLVEIVVVVSIISILCGIVLASISQARQNSRDKERIADLANIKFALVLYREKNNTYPTGSDVIIGANPATTFDTTMVPFIPNTLSDPLYGKGGYFYRYNADFTCTEAHQRVVYAQTVENSGTANFSTLCTHSNAGAYPGAITGTTPVTVNSYIMILK